MLNLILLNVLKITAAVNDILYTGFNYYIIIAEIPINFLKKPLYIKLSFFKKAYLYLF